MALGFQNRVSPFLLLLIAIATLGPLQFGYHLAELNAPEDVISCRRKLSAPSTISRLLSSTSSSPKTTPDSSSDCIPMPPATFATISSLFTVGALAGALLAGPISSARGRRFSMRLTSLFFVLGSALEALASNTILLGLGRMLNGCGAGAATVIVPLYISEVAPPAERGLFGAATQVSINLGILLTQTLGYFWSHGSMWRWVLGTGVVLGGVHAMGLVLVPESPGWLAGVKGDVGAAKRTLQRIRGRDADIEEEALLEGDGAAEEVAAPMSPRREDTGKKEHLGFVQVVRDPLYRPAIVAVVGIMFAQQFCGINSIIMYSVSLLADLLPISSSVMTILLSVVNLLATVSFSPLPDKLGRKACLLISILGQGTSALVLALAILFDIKILSAVAVLFFVASFAVGLGPVPFILASEMVGQEAVGATQSWALGSNYVATFIVAQFFPILNQALNRSLGGAGWVYFIFAACAALFAGFVAWKVPETRGRKDADEVWGRTRRID